jgi:acetaldehyde dehydrogenase (acetylating)
MGFDKDLASIQESRDLVNTAYEAGKIWGQASQTEVDRVCEAMAAAGVQSAERLGRLAQETQERVWIAPRLGKHPGSENGWCDST